VLAAAAAEAAPDSDPVALIKAIYATYETDTPGLENIYSTRLQALLDKDEKETPEGEVGRIDWDVFVNGQDWKLSELKITLVSKTADRAQIRASFKNFGDANNILFDLVRENGAWRVDDVQNTLPPRWTMSKILTDAPDAFPDAKQGDPPKPTEAMPMRRFGACQQNPTRRRFPQRSIGRGRLQHAQICELPHVDGCRTLGLRRRGGFSQTSDGL
jgi:hypothetical protein